MFLKKIIYFAFAFSILTLLMNCKKTKEDDGSEIPYVHVNFNINVSSALYNSLNSPGDWAYFDDVGVKGIIIYRNS